MTILEAFEELPDPRREHPNKLHKLITSCEPLRLRAEHVYDVKGMSIPGEATRLEEYDGVQLFIQQAKRQQSSFVLNADNRTEIITLCELLGGMPLAIELAAAWIRVLPLSEIIAEINQGLDFLEANSRDIPERHRSIKAVFDYSWELLSEREQAALRKLSVLKGGFSREAAKKVADVSLTELANLIDKSLLTTTERGRYRRHSLVIQYAQEKAEQHPAEHADMQHKHGLYFFAYLREHAPKVRTLKRKATLEMLEPDIPNIKAAWSWALAQERLDDIADHAKLVGYIFDTGRRFEAEHLHTEVINTLDETNPLHHRALGYALVLKGKDTFYLSPDPRSIQSSVQKGVALLQGIDDNKGIILALRIKQLRPDRLLTTTDVGITPEEGLTLARQFGDPDDVGAMLQRKLYYERKSLPFSIVNNHFQEALSEIRELDDPIQLMSILQAYGVYLVNENHVAKGRAYLEEALVLAQSLDLISYWTSIYNNLGFAAFKEKQDQALAFFEEAYRLGSSAQVTPSQARSLAYQGRIAIRNSDKLNAITHLQGSLQLPSDIPQRLETILGVAEYKRTFISPAEAVTLLQFTIDHPQAEKREKDQAVELLEQLKTELAADAFRAAVEASHSLTLEQVVEEALRLTA